MNYERVNKDFVAPDNGFSILGFIDSGIFVLNPNLDNLDLAIRDAKNIASGSYTINTAGMKGAESLSHVVVVDDVGVMKYVAVPEDVSEYEEMSP